MHAPDNEMPEGEKGGFEIAALASIEGRVNLLITDLCMGEIRSDRSQFALIARSRKRTSYNRESNMEEKWLVDMGQVEDSDSIES